MEQIQTGAVSLRGIGIALLMAMLFGGMVVAEYGLDGVVPGAHDGMHDYRHANGMPCH
ncbi:MAG: CbtB-domain containing protein [Deltaproteobacteria bacterium]|nr:CbtB-domain containing protein [Deltaproteobacteria bacterium]